MNAARIIGTALANTVAWVYVSLVFWLSKHADTTVCAWTNRTAGEDER